MSELIMGNVIMLKAYLKDFLPRTSGCILTTADPSATGEDLKVSSIVGTPKLKMNPGLAYWQYDRFNFEEETTFDLSTSLDINGNPITFPTGNNEFVTRSDIMGIWYTERRDDPKNIDFLQTNNNIRKETVFTSIYFGGEIVYIQGSRLSGHPPTIPEFVLPLAQVNLRDNATSVNVDDIIDLREPYLYNRKIDE